MFWSFFVCLLVSFVALAGVPYKALFVVEPSDDLLQKALVDASYLELLHDKLPDTVEDLRWRAERDATQLERFLYSKGYMLADVDYAITSAEEDKPTLVTITARPSQPFQYSHIAVESADTPDWLKDFFIETETMRVGAQVDYDNIKIAQKKIEKEAKNRGHPWVELSKPLLDLSPNDFKARLVFPVKFGSQSVIHSTTIQGLQNVDLSYVRNRLEWRDGQVFDQRLIDQTKETLIATALFGEVDIQIQPCPGEGERVNIVVKLTEGPARSIGVGLRYATSEGVGGRIFWRHKNIWGKAQSLELGSKRTKLQRKTEAKWSTPDFFVPHQTLFASAFFSTERQRTYRGNIDGGSVVLVRPLWSHQWTGKLGVLADRSRLKQDEIKYTSQLWGLPAQLTFDGSNDWLNPTQGLRLEGWGTPFWGTLNRKRSTFVTTRLHASGYIPLSSSYRGEEPVIVLAGFGRLGKIFSKSLVDIPPHQRFYAGGADSIRAYGPQLLGPLDANRVPLGGVFLTEYGGEVRFRTSENVGFVLFAEAGSLTNHSASSTFDHFKAKALWGVGTGLRYYTPLGPIRADVAVPTTRRRDGNKRTIDSPYQLYISFGQAF